MPSSKRADKPGHVIKGSIFDDLGLSPEKAIEVKVKSELWRDLINHIEGCGFDQNYLKMALKIHQPDVSNLMRGKIYRFSTGKLIQFAVSLNFGVHVQLSAPKSSKRTMSHTSASKTHEEDRELVGTV